MKRVSVIFLALLFVFTGCAAQSDNDDRPLIVTTIFPIYDFVRAVAGDTVNIKMLIKPGSESHTYEPTPHDIVEINSAALFAYNGGESESWAADILASLDGKAPTFRMMDYVEKVEEELAEGMEGGEEADETGEIEYDEHIWTSLRNSAAVIAALSDKLCEIFPENAELYKANADSYSDAILALDTKLTSLFADCEKPLIFGDRFPFRYFAQDYGLKYYAAFPGCSSETEPSAATITFLINKVKESGVSKIFYLELSKRIVCDVITDETGIEGALLHSCHNVSEEEFNGGKTYLSLMTRNVQTLTEVYG